MKLRVRIVESVSKDMKSYHRPMRLVWTVFTARSALWRKSIN